MAMDYNLIREILDLLKDFEQSSESGSKYPITKEGFTAWVAENYVSKKQNEERISNLEK